MSDSPRPPSSVPPSADPAGDYFSQAFHASPALLMIGRLPDNCTIEDIFYHLDVMAKVKRGLADIEAGRVYSQDEAERLLADWIAARCPRRAGSE